MYMLSRELGMGVGWIGWSLIKVVICFGFVAKPIPLADRAV